MPEAKPGPVLPLVPFGKHRITRLVAGANPVYGYSHFNYVFSAHMGEYHTTERVLSFLRELERAGLNTWQASWSERLETDWLKYKDQGGKLQLLLLSRPNFNDQPEMLRRAMKLKPMGIAQHGVSTNRFWDAGQFDNCRDYLKHIRETGVMVGLSCHNPPELEPPLPGDSAILGAATWSNGLGGRPFVANASARCHPVRRTTPRSRQRTRKHCLHL